MQIFVKTVTKDMSSSALSFGYFRDLLKELNMHFRKILFFFMGLILNVTIVLIYHIGDTILD